MIERTQPEVEVLPVQTTFDLELLDRASQPVIEGVITRVRHRTESMAQAYIDNGRDLLLAKQHIPYGMWTDFIQSQFSWSRAIAADMMRVARQFGDLYLEGSQVSASVLIMLTRNDMPRSIREIATNAIATGDITSISDAANLIRQHDPVLADRVEAVDHSGADRNRRRALRDLTLQIAEMSFAVRNMQQALSSAYGVPLRSNVADALQHLQEVSDALIKAVPKPDSITSTQGIKRSPSANRYVGMHWNKRRQKWHATLSHKNKNIHIGYFDTEEEAARAYDAKARELYGDQARLNFPDERP